MTAKNTNSSKAPSLRNARSFISTSGLLPETHLHVANATTAVTFQSADNAELSINEQENLALEVHAANLNNASLLGSFSPNFESVEGSDDEEMTHSNHDGMRLPEMLSDLMIASGGRHKDGDDSYDGLNPFTGNDTVFDEDFLRLKVLVDKLDSQFTEKLKHFFILSAAGKPIYSLHGNDDIIMGYMGLITTIMASFQEGMRRDVHSITLDLVKVVVKSKFPLVLVAMSKIPHEMSLLSENGGSIMENQLEFLYNYIVAVLSKNVITKNFDSGMNYDLRRILTVQDIHALDTLAMKLTYGFSELGDQSVCIDLSFYLSSILGNAMRSVRISNTCRAKVNDYLLSVKKLKTTKESTDFISTISNKLSVSEEGTFVAEDLLFGFITLNDRVLSHIRPRNHKLLSRDIATMLSIVNMSMGPSSEGGNTDLWIPLCMPEFNSSGFLYCYVKNFTLEYLSLPLTIILVSGSKNSFYNMKDSAHHVVTKIKTNRLFLKRLAQELSHFSGQASILRELSTSAVKHFIYKRKEFNQVFVDDIAGALPLSEAPSILASSQMISLYSSLINSKGLEIHTEEAKPKKLTYKRLRLNNSFITGFLLTDKNYEFYCLCEGPVKSRTIIDESLRIIRWCDRYRKRLFTSDNALF